MTIRLGIIGLSPGNGHPYSWSAICNGYEPIEMQRCGFPTISEYLGKQNWPASRLAEVEVTHVWTQERSLSNRIARAARIQNVVDRPDQMFGYIDALLLARDDSENHAKFAVPFLDAGLPVYLDKPVALSSSALSSLYDHEQYPGQIFSCSALGYAKELTLSDAVREELGTIHQIIAMTPKYWDTYAMHLIEPVFQQSCRKNQAKNVTPIRMGDATSVMAEWDDGFRASLHALGSISAPIAFDVIGEKGYKRLVFKDSFSAFRAALADFIEGVSQRTTRSERTKMHAMVNLLERGRG